MRLKLHRISLKCTGFKPIRAVIGKDLSSLFLNPTGWLLVLVFNLVILWLFMQSYFLIGQVDLIPLFILIQWGFIILAAALGAKSFAEERQKNTLELLSSLPLTARQIVWAKFLAGAGVFGLISLILLPSLIVISQTGPLDWGQTFSAWLGAGLLFCLYYSWGSYISLFFKNIVVGFLMNLLIFFGFYVLSSSFVLDRLPPRVAVVLSAFSLEAHYRSFMTGVPSLAALVFMTSLIFLFIELTVSRLSYQDRLL